MKPLLKRIQTSQLDMAFLDVGDPDGKPVVLLHGWPDDPTTWNQVSVELTKKGCRAFIPYLRGFGPTRFLASGSARSGQLAALGQDVIELIERLGLERFVLVGHDWGARAAYIVAALHPVRVRGLLTLSVGYATNDPRQKLAYAQARAYWYHWFFASSLGKAALESDRRGLCRFLWKTWSPSWRFTDQEFEETATSWENPDWAEVTLHSYRYRWGQAKADPSYQELEDKMSQLPKIHVPTILIQGTEDACNLPETSADKDRFFTAGYRYVLVKAGHFIQREDPRSVVDAALELLSADRA
jgi:pimeloyl-ACP methyl ester carboxylesterase